MVYYVNSDTGLLPLNSISSITYCFHYIYYKFETTLKLYFIQHKQ